MIEIYSIRKHFMENIQLTTETREQILRHVSERERKAKVQTMKKWTKYLSVAACCALVVELLMEFIRYIRTKQSVRKKI